MVTKAKKGLQKRLSANREKRQLKSRATHKVTSKSDLIRSMLAKNLSASQIKANIEKKGLSIYPSEIYRVKNA